MDATRSVSPEICWAHSAHSSKSRAVGEGTLSQIAEITIAVTATMVAGSRPVRLAINMPNYFLGQAAMAILSGVFPAVLWRTGHTPFFFVVNTVSHLFNLAESVIGRRFAPSVI
jgi:hypothetical protein